MSYCNNFFFLNFLSGKVRAALLWLKDNNPFYFDIELSEENLASLPDDENVYNQISTRIVADPEHNITENQDSLEEEVENEDNFCNVTESGVPMTRKPNESQQIRNTLGYPK